MVELSERLNTPISTSELERRWTAARAAMQDHGIDVLLMQSNNDYMGGYVKYFTDLPATNGYPLTVVFPRDDGMTMIRQGPMGMVREAPIEGDGVLRGVTCVMTTPSFASAQFTKDYDAELAAKALEPYAGGAIGLLGVSQMSYALVDYLKNGKFASAKFVDASDMVDRIKAVKSDEELGLIRRTAAMQDAAMEAAIAAIEPGKRESDIAAVARRVGEGLGSEQGIVLCASGPMGTPVIVNSRHMQNRLIREGDQFVLLVEINGPGGFYTELGRTCVLGKASQRLLDEFAFTLEARRRTLALMQPGTPCKEIWAAHNEFMRRNDRPEEKRIYSHGQGYDLVERPLVRNDEPMAIEKNISFSIHPSYVLDDLMSWVCDNYIIGDDGPGERIHAFPEKIVEL